MKKTEKIAVVSLITFILLIVTFRGPFLPRNAKNKFKKYNGIILQPAGCYGALLRDYYKDPPLLITQPSDLQQPQLLKVILNDPILRKMTLTTWDDMTLLTLSSIAYQAGYNYIGLAKGRAGLSGEMKILLMKELPMYAGEYAVPCYSKYWTKDNMLWSDLTPEQVEEKKKHKLENWVDSTKNKGGGYEDFGCGHSAWQLPPLNSCQEDTSTDPDKDNKGNICCGFPCTLNGKNEYYTDSEGKKRQFMCGGMSFKTFSDMMWSTYRLVRINQKNNYSKWANGRWKLAGDDAMGEADLQAMAEDFLKDRNRGRGEGTIN